MEASAFFKTGMFAFYSMYKCASFHAECVHIHFELAFEALAFMVPLRVMIQNTLEVLCIPLSCLIPCLSPFAFSLFSACIYIFTFCIYIFSNGPHGKSAGTPQLPISMPVDLTSLSNSAFVRFAIGLQTKKETCIRSGTNKSSHMHVIMCECTCDLVCPHFERVLRFPASASSLLTTGPSPASVISKTRAF